MEAGVTRYFTPEEANALLPAVVARVVRIADELRRAREIAEHAPAPDDPVGAAQQRLDALRTTVEADLAWIHDMGVHLKGVDPALLDFPALRHGHEVYLCWREGEEDISHWHPLHTGIAGRQPLEPPESGIWEWCH